MTLDRKREVRGIISSDWNGCLAPCGPFDCIAFNHPDLKSRLKDILRQYTGNFITLGEATRRIEKLLPDPLPREKMDDYLRDVFATYPGVPDLIEWCAREDILFMINTTGMIGYFQRVFALELLPTVPVLSAHPMIRYPMGDSDSESIFTLLETIDKARYTARMAHKVGVKSARVIVLGDSGGDGPHFAWAAEAGARRIGSMTKPSLETYCRKAGISIDVRFGRSYAPGEKRELEQEMQFDFMDLVPKIEDFLAP